MRRQDGEGETRRPLLAAALLALLAACQPAIPSSAPASLPPTPSATTAASTSSPSAGPTAEASPTERPTPTPVTVPTQAGQVRTSWGVAWDTIPSWFPRPDGAQPTQTGGEPASAELDVPPRAATTAEVVAFYRTALEVGEYAYTVDGPLEDGSFTIDATDRAACLFRVVVAPLGDHTLIRVFYGLGCRIR